MRYLVLYFLVTQITMATNLYTLRIGDIESIAYGGVGMPLFAGFEVVYLAESIRVMHFEPKTARIIMKIGDKKISPTPNAFVTALREKGSYH